MTRPAPRPSYLTELVTFEAGLGAEPRVALQTARQPAFLSAVETELTVLMHYDPPRQEQTHAGSIHT